MKNSWLERLVVDTEVAACGYLVTQMMPGDELWTYSSPQEDWDHLAGEAGFALVRDGEIIAYLVEWCS